MKNNYHIILIIMLGLVFSGCNEENKSTFNKECVQGEWMGGALFMDQDFYTPFSRIMDFKNDSVYFKSILGNPTFKTKLTFSNDSIKIDTLSIPINKFKIEGDQLHYMRYRAHRLIVSDSLDIRSFETVLTSGFWRKGNDVFGFDTANKQLRMFPNGKNRFFIHCYDVVSYQNKIFLIKKGNQLSCKRDFQFLEQVLSFTDKKIETFGFKDGVFKKMVYEATSIPSEIVEPVDFQLCNPYLKKNNPRDRYYYHGTEYNGGHYHIRKIFGQRYKVPEGSKESGIFQVRFVVNCEGKAGMFESQAFDYDYNLKEFSPQISDQIFEITKGLQDWIPGRHPQTNQDVDTYIYLSFRIKDGKIIRIYP